MNDRKDTSYLFSGEPFAKGRIGAQRWPIVLVVGMPRSGMSLCAHILSAMGIDMADETSAHPSNPGNQWERQEIVEFHDRILGLFNRAYFGPFHDLALPVAWWADPRVCEIRREIVAFLRTRMGDSYFGFKDPRTVRLMPVWHHIVNDLNLAPKVVFCLRNPSQVARSLMARDGVDLEIGEYRSLIYMIDFFRYTKTFDVCMIEYGGWLNEPLANFEKLRKFLYLRWPQSEFDLDLTLSGIIDPALNHDDSDHRRTSQSLVHSLYELASHVGLDGTTGEQISGIVSQFVNFQQLQRPLQQAFEDVAEVAAKFPQIEQEAAFLRAAIGERDQIVETANGRASAAEARVAQIEQEAASLRAAIGERDQIVEIANGRASAAEARVAQIEQEAASLRAAIGERDQIVETANGRASAAEAQVAEALQHLKQEAQEHTAAAEAMRVEIARLRSELAVAREVGRVVFAALQTDFAFAP